VKRVNCELVHESWQPYLKAVNHPNFMMDRKNMNILKTSAFLVTEESQAGWNDNGGWKRDKHFNNTPHLVFLQGITCPSIQLNFKL